MKCRRAQHLLFDFIDGMSDEVLRAELDRHLAECEGCERFAREMTGALSLLKRAPMETLDETFNWKVRLAIHRERNANRGGAAAGAWVRAWNLRYAASAGIAFAVVLGVGVGLVAHDALMRSDTMQTAQTARVAPATTDSSPAATPVSPPLVPGRPGVSGRGTLVSFGGHPMVGGGIPVGAIDPSASEAVIDSVMNDQLKLLSPDDQARFLVRWIDRLQTRLQSQQSVQTPRP